MSEERTILNWENDEKRMLSTRRDGRTTSSGASSKFWQVICWPLSFQRARYFFREREPGSFMALLLNGEASVIKEGK